MRTAGDFQGTPSPDSASLYLNFNELKFYFSLLSSRENLIRAFVGVWFAPARELTVCEQRGASLGQLTLLFN